MIHEKHIVPILELQGKFTPVRGEIIPDFDLAYALIQANNHDPRVARALKTNIDEHLNPSSKQVIYRKPKPFRGNPSIASVGFVGPLVDNPEIKAVYMAHGSDAVGYKAYDQDPRVWVGLFTPMRWLQAIRSGELNLLGAERIESSHLLKRAIHDITEKVRGQERRYEIPELADIPVVPREGALPPIMAMDMDLATCAVAIMQNPRGELYTRIHVRKDFGEYEDVLPIAERIDRELNNTFSAK